MVMCFILGHILGALASSSVLLFPSNMAHFTAGFNFFTLQNLTNSSVDVHERYHLAHGLGESYVFCFRYPQVPWNPGALFCLSLAAPWGYLFGRVPMMEGFCQKKSGFSSITLCMSLCVVAVLWLVAIFAWNWDAPVQLVSFRPLARNQNELQNWYRKHKGQQLQ
jgi:hypothetical protein